MLTSHIIRVAVEAALAEDAPYGDITCETTIPADETGSAHLTARENGVMSGIDVFAAAFAAQNPAVTVTAAIKDGERFQRGQILATVKGPVRDLLTAERIALNFTQRMSGIATMTAAFVDAVNAIYGDDYDGPVTRRAATSAPASSIRAKPRPACARSRNTPWSAAAATTIVTDCPTRS